MFHIVNNEHEIIMYTALFFYCTEKSMIKGILENHDTFFSVVD